VPASIAAISRTSANGRCNSNCRIFAQSRTQPAARPAAGGEFPHHRRISQARASSSPIRRSASSPRPMFHIVLFEPEIPPNTGNAIRLCANTGATLHLIKPLGFRLDDKSLQRSGLDYHDLADVKIHVDSTAASRHSRVRACLRSRPADAGCYAQSAYRAGDALLFGPETRGLPAALLERVGDEHSLCIPMRPRAAASTCRMRCRWSPTRPGANWNLAGRRLGGAA
jgi:tRNA (cytidine/uridine-2'-O-)-methyltransferase